VFLSKSRIKVRRLGVKFCSTSIYQFKDTFDPHLISSLVKNFTFQAPNTVANLPVCISLSLSLFDKLFRDSIQMEFGNGFIQIHQFLNLLKEPFVNLRQILNRAEGNSKFKCVINVEKPVPTWVLQAIQQFGLVFQFFPVCPQSVSSDFQ